MIKHDDEVGEDPAIRCGTFAAQLDADVAPWEFTPADWSALELGCCTRAKAQGSGCRGCTARFAAIDKIKLLQEELAKCETLLDEGNTAYDELAAQLRLERANRREVEALSAHLASARERVRQFLTERQTPVQIPVDVQFVPEAALSARHVALVKFVGEVGKILEQTDDEDLDDAARRVMRYLKDCRQTLEENSVLHDTLRQVLAAGYEPLLHAARRVVRERDEARAEVQRLVSAIGTTADAAGVNGNAVFADQKSHTADEIAIASLAALRQHVTLVDVALRAYANLWTFAAKLVIAGNDAAWLHCEQPAAVWDALRARGLAPRVPK